MAQLTQEQQHALMGAWYDINHNGRLNGPALNTKNLRRYVGGLTNLHAWVGYNVSPNLMRVTARPQMPVRPRGIAIQQADRWMIHRVRIGSRQVFGVSPLEASRALLRDFDGCDGVEAIDMSREAMRGDDFCEQDIFSRPPLDLQDIGVDETLPTGIDIELTVEYIGDVEGGELFNAVLYCDGENLQPRAAVAPRMVLPLASAVRLGATNNGWRVLLALGDRVIRFEERAGRLDCVERANHDELAAARTKALSFDPFLAIGYYVCELKGCVVTVHVGEIGHQVGSTLRSGGLVIYGVDERTDRVVFEIIGGERAFRARFVAAGFEPDWRGHLPHAHPEHP